MQLFEVCGFRHRKQTLSLLVVGIVAEVEAELALSMVLRPEEILAVAALSLDMGTAALAVIASRRRSVAQVGLGWVE